VRVHHSQTATNISKQIPPPITTWHADENVGHWLKYLTFVIQFGACHIIATKTYLKRLAFPGQWHISKRKDQYITNGVRWGGYLEPITPSRATFQNMAYFCCLISTPYIPGLVIIWEYHSQISAY
jgi:hypothetical protein